MNKKKFPKRSIHLDFHTMPGVYDVGCEFDADDFAAILKNAHVEYITVFARCNLGFAYYPTKIGTVHPGLKFDLLGAMVKACRKRGIGVGAYFNAGIDHEHALRHREWCKVNRQGQVCQYQEMGSGFRDLCLNTGYGDHLLAMIRETLDKYPVDELFLDCFHMAPCYGIECLDGMEALKMDPSDEQQAREYYRIVTGRFTADVKKIVKRLQPGIRVWFNSTIPFNLQQTHIEIEVLPTGGWGYDFLPWVIRYARTLKKPVITMTGRFHGSWGDFGGLRTEPSIMFDLCYSLANGGNCMIGDHLHPRGKLDPAVYSLISRVYGKIKELDRWTENARALAEIAIIDPRLQKFPADYWSDRYGHIAGAARMLGELKYQFDVSDGNIDLSSYKVVILPDYVAVDADLKIKLEQYVKKGGVIISSAWSGLNPEKTGFAMRGFNAVYEGAETHNPAFFKPAPAVSDKLSDMPVSIYKPGIAMRAGKGAAILAELWKPYFNLKSWDWRHENLYTPPERKIKRPALIRSKNIFHFSFPIFSGYYEDAVVAHKILFGNCLRIALPSPMIKIADFPSFGQVTITRQDKRRIVHLLTYVPELRGRQMQIIEEPITVANVKLSLKQDGFKIKRVYLAPSGQELVFKTEGEYITATIPEVSGYQMAVYT